MNSEQSVWYPFHTNRRPCMEGRLRWSGREIRTRYLESAARESAPPPTALQHPKQDQILPFTLNTVMFCASRWTQVWFHHLPIKLGSQRVPYENHCNRLACALTNRNKYFSPRKLYVNCQRTTFLTVKDNNHRPTNGSDLLGRDGPRILPPWVMVEAIWVRVSPIRWHAATLGKNSTCISLPTRVWYQSIFFLGGMKGLVGMDRVWTMNLVSKNRRQ